MSIKPSICQGCLIFSVVTYLFPRLDWIFLISLLIFFCFLYLFPGWNTICKLKHKNNVRNIWGGFLLSFPQNERKIYLVCLSYFVSVCIFFEESVFTFQFLNDKIHNYVKKIHLALSSFKN